MSIDIKNQKIIEVPKEWAAVSLGEILTLLRNGLTASQNKRGNGYPVSRIETISEEKINPEKVGYASEIKTNDLDEYKLIEGDILFSHINSLAHIGKTAIYLGIPNVLLHGMNLLLLRSDREKVNPLFLLYLLRLFRLKAIFRNMSKKAVNQASINQTELSKLKILLPPLPEQQKIAEILTTVDESIEKTEQAIDKTQRLKKGLMQELLTKGIGHKEFKETEIGKIPKKWEVARIKKRANIKYGLSQPPEIASSGIPMIRATNIKRGEIISDEMFNVNPESIPNSKNPYLNEGDIIIVRSGAYTGDVALVTKRWAGAIAGYDLIISLEKDSVNPEFLTYCLLSNSVQRYFAGQRERSAQPHLNARELGNTLIPLPPLSEQKKIADILSTVDRRLELLRMRREKLESIKKGLMNDLLTGKKRVKLE